MILNYGRDIFMVCGELSFGNLEMSFGTSFVCRCDHVEVNDPPDLGWTSEVQCRRNAFNLCVDARIGLFEGDTETWFSNS